MMGRGEGTPIHTPMIRLETAENHPMYFFLMPSDNFIVKKRWDSGRNQT